MSDTLGRRDFLKTTTQATAITVAAAATASAKAPTNRQIDLTNAMPARALGKRIGVKLPILCFGGSALTKLWGNTSTYEYRVDVIRHAYKRGIRYFDTAGNYGKSEPIIGKALEGKRDKVFLASKTETFVPGEVRKAVEGSLKRLRTDYLDLLQIHGSPGVEQMTFKQTMKIHGEYVKLQDEGIIRFIGLTAHAYYDKALPLISSGAFDQCMLAYGYLPKGWMEVFSPKMIQHRNACLAKAHELGVGIVVMKVLAAGILGAQAKDYVPGFDAKQLRRLPAAAIRAVLDDERVDSLTIGMRHKAEIDENIKTFSGNTEYTPEDRALLADFCLKALSSKKLKGLRLV